MNTTVQNHSQTAQRNEKASTSKDSHTQGSIHEQNVAAIVNFIKTGIKKPGSHGRLGIELEHIVCHSDLKPVGYSDKYGVAWLLNELKESYPQATYDDEGDILGVARPHAAVTIEPAAQFELSAGPFESLEVAKETFDAFEYDVNKILSPHNEQLITQGYHPSATARSLELIPKQRYDFMNKYLSKVDTCGPCMMRGSAATQISIDFTSVEDCLRKYRLAYALVPLLSLMCDNSPVFEGKPRKQQLVRTYIWEHMDNDRCGLIPGALDKNFTLEAYAEKVLSIPAILIPDGKGGWRYTEKTFDEEYAEQAMTEGDVAHALSMLFPDVRLKTYIEIRPADSMPIPYVIAYAGLIKGLFYNDENLNKLEELFEKVTTDDYAKAKKDLMAKGYEANVYGKPVAELIDSIMALAKSALDRPDQSFLQPLSELVEQRTTLACIAERNTDE